MAKCQRDGCEHETKQAWRKFCSMPCCRASRSPEFYRRLARLGHAAHRKKGHKALRQIDVMLMAQGRYAEAALAIYDRGYSAGWVACKKGNRQLPQRRIA